MGKTYNWVSDADKAIIRAAALKNPQMTWTEFKKAHPKFKASSFTYVRYRKKILTEAGRADEMSYLTKPRGKRERSLYTKTWNYPVADFNKDPLVGLADFLQSLTNAGRASFELIKIEKQDKGKWVSHLEIRES